MMHDLLCDDCTLLALEYDDAKEKTLKQEDLYKEVPTEEHFARLNIRRQFEIRRARTYQDHLKTH